MSEKAFNILIQKVEQWRKDGESIVLCHGCFDPLHIGHLLHFKAAKKSADHLIVTITPNRFVNKGENRPIFSEELRLEMVEGLKVVDAAAINLWDSAVETIRNLKPDYFAKGWDYFNRSNCNPNILLEERELEKYSGKIIFTDEKHFSSTKLLEWLNKT